MKKLLICLLLTACTTPQTVMVKNGVYITCGGSMTGSLAGGVIGYHFQKSLDQDCVQEYLDKGFVRADK